MWDDGRAKIGSGELMLRAWKGGIVIPAFNVPYLPMMRPIVRALRDTRCIGFVAVARLEWEKFRAGGVREVFEEYQRCKDEPFSRLHLDHVPVVDEDGKAVPYVQILEDAAELGYDSLMVDGSRLPLEENIAATRRAAEIAHGHGIALEAELGSVLGHEEGPLPPYDELFASGRGFTDPQEARRFVEASGADWLSVAVGNVHGAISVRDRGKDKVEARLAIDHLRRINEAAGCPLVLHGGSGIRKRYLLEGFRTGIAKINIGTAVRQVYERAAGLVGSGADPSTALDAVYAETVRLIRDELGIEGSQTVLAGA